MSGNKKGTIGVDTLREEGEQNTDDSREGEYSQNDLNREEIRDGEMKRWRKC